MLHLRLNSQKNRKFIWKKDAKNKTVKPPNTRTAWSRQK